MPSPSERAQWPPKMKNNTKLRPKMKHGQKTSNTIVKCSIYNKLAPRVYMSK